MQDDTSNEAADISDALESVLDSYRTNGATDAATAAALVGLAVGMLTKIAGTDGAAYALSRVVAKLVKPT